MIKKMKTAYISWGFLLITMKSCFGIIPTYGECHLRFAINHGGMVIVTTSITKARYWLCKYCADQTDQPTMNMFLKNLLQEG